MQILQSAGHTSTPHVIFPIEILFSASIAWHELVEGTPLTSSNSLNCPQVVERSSNQIFVYELQSSREKEAVGAGVRVDDGFGLIVGSKLVGLDDGEGVSGHGMLVRQTSHMSHPAGHSSSLHPISPAAARKLASPQVPVSTSSCSHLSAYESQSERSNITVGLGLGGSGQSRIVLRQILHMTHGIPDGHSLSHVIFPSLTKAMAKVHSPSTIKLKRHC